MSNNVIDMIKKGGNFQMKKQGGVVITIIIIILAALVIFNSNIVLSPGEAAVIFNKVTGHMRLAANPGFYILIPFVESSYRYDIKIQTYTMSQTQWEGEIKGDDSLKALTSDGQVVYLDLTVRYHPDVNKLIKLHQEIGMDYATKVIRPQIRSFARLTISKYPVIDVYSGKREIIQDEIYRKLLKVFKINYIILDEVLLRDVRFSADFQKAIERKQIAQQEAKRMEYLKQAAKIEAEKKVIEAEGEAKALRVKGAALASNPALIQYEYVQKLAPTVQTIITDGKTIISLGDILKNKK